MMDYIYVIRHAHTDRLESAGVIQYRPADGFRLRLPRLRIAPTPVRHLRAAAVAAIQLIAR
ncbi:MAG: hypothetical protein K8J31_20210 [Anaerolineae bacterium]|nr:hypothetical protein [Anaerolineae bacterium]